MTQQRKDNVMTRTAKQTEAERVSRTRASMRAQALLMGWRPMDVLGVYQDGLSFIIIERDGARFVTLLSEDGQITDGPSPSQREYNKKDRKLVAPPSWDPETWNDNLTHIIERDMSKDDVRKTLTQASDSQGTKKAEKKLRQALAVIDATPDTPDWYDSLPIAISVEEG